MTNPFYNRAFEVLQGASNRSDAVEAEFSAVEAGFGLIDARFVPIEADIAAAKGTAPSFSAAVFRYEAGLTQNLDANNKRVMNLSAPVSANDGARLADVDAAKAYALSLAFSATLPGAAGNFGKQTRVGAGDSISWADWWGTPIDATGALALAVRSCYWLDTTAGAFNVTLPANPAHGDWVWLVDKKGALATNKVTVLRNGRLIRMTAEDLELDVAFDSVLLVFDSATNSWIEQ